jgi:hypothetical protein
MAIKRVPKAAAGSAASPDRTKVFVRMYRHGLGDCFLLRLPHDNGGSFNILIDCGLIGVAKEPKTVMESLVADIRTTCGRLNLVVLTHEHWDHASGFSTQQVQAAFDDIEIDEVWYAWTEDPDNALGKKLRKERESKLKALHRAVAALRSTNTPLALRRADRVASLLGFFGGEDIEAFGAAAGTAPKPGKTRLAFEYVGRRAGIKRRYCYPKDDPTTFANVPGVRVYVLGPPEDEGLIKRSAPTKKGKEVYEFAADFAIDDNLSSAFEHLQTGASGAAGKDCPFDLTYSRWLKQNPGSGSEKLEKLIDEIWNVAGEEFRQIEDDWTAAAETLALNLDTHTNNTCLVLAFELIASGRVLLFAADAQVGNWMSWQNTKWTLREGAAERGVTGPDLLRRTVFYKVGHHGSHNATLRALGLEQMTSNELVAFVPVFKEQAEANRWNSMPFLPLVGRLKEKTGGRLVVSDPKVAAPAGADLNSLSEKQRGEFIARLKIDPLYYEYSFDL